MYIISRYCYANYNIMHILSIVTVKHKSLFIEINYHQNVLCSYFTLTIPKRCFYEEKKLVLLLNYVC